MEQELYLPSPGSIPGIPGLYATGHYLIDRDARTLRPLPTPDSEAAPPEPSVAVLAQEVEQLAAAVAQEQAPIARPAPLAG